LTLLSFGCPSHFKLQCANSQVIQHQGVWIEYIIKYWAILARWWCTRKKLTSHKAYMSDRHAYEKKLQCIAFNRKCKLSKI